MTRDNIQLKPNEYVIKIKAWKLLEESCIWIIICNEPGMVEEEIDGIKTVEPAFGLPAIWIAKAEKIELKC